MTDNTSIFVFLYKTIYTWSQVAISDKMKLSKVYSLWLLNNCTDRRGIWFLCLTNCRAMYAKFDQIKTIYNKDTVLTQIWKRLGERVIQHATANCRVMCVTHHFLCNKFLFQNNLLNNRRIDQNQWSSMYFTFMNCFEV